MQANLRIIKRREIEGTISLDDFEIRLNKTRKSLLKIIDNLSNEDLITPYLDKAPIKISDVKNKLSVFVDSYPILSIIKPDGLRGKVGIRPWKSKNQS